MTNMNNKYVQMKEIEKIDEFTRIIYVRIKMPLIQTRDKCMKVSVLDKNGGKFVKIDTIERPDVPVYPGIVRM